MQALKCQILSLAVLALLALGASSALAAEHELTLAYLPVKGTLYVEVTEKFAEQVATATEGRVEIILNDSLVKGTQLAQSVRDGRVQLSTILAGYYSATNPEFGLAQLPGLMNNLEEYKQVFYGFWREDMNRILDEKYNSRVLVWGMFAPQNLISTEPITTVADFDGKKIRIHNIETGTLVSALGAKPTPMSASEVMPALQRGVIDGVFTSSAWAYGQAFYTVATHLSHWPISTILPFPIVINNQSWKSLPADLQKIVASVGQQLEEEAFANYTQSMETLPQKWEAKGGQYFKAGPEQIEELFRPEHIAPVYESFFERAEKAGLGGKAYVEKAESILGKDLGY